MAEFRARSRFERFKRATDSEALGLAQSGCVPCAILYLSQQSPVTTTTSEYWYPTPKVRYPGTI
eukprot:1595435-Rhodomonas_salina.2